MKIQSITPLAQQMGIELVKQDKLAKIKIAQGDEKRKAGMDMFVRTAPSGKGLTFAYTKTGANVGVNMEDANKRDTSNTDAYANMDKLVKEQQFNTSMDIQA